MLWTSGLTRFIRLVKTNLIDSGLYLPLFDNYLTIGTDYILSHDLIIANFHLVDEPSSTWEAWMRIVSAVKILLYPPTFAEVLCIYFYITVVLTGLTRFSRSLKVSQKFLSNRITIRFH